ncbi:5-oxoprolinase subunit B family protein [Tuwongella immobilis]|uniref:Carboxyltransferase domain-containing protein n=1 Tax=Tuwongella immobilis TaxID=692036 RepID=A0A6C2YL12_9BACT|nr:allophanate hydrolase subunit 1 [Tuwongella immobilis]VIP02268.1 Allophanate hydrolase subunit 1 OS=Fimbriimonas ginsengisoli Gsoil 348 GN=OP10G_2085 PE=4 SV=1: AHS1 [Tuwongella immobilis]VTS00890.1 Allophanate hydrolase subunit 1 OS=Fimbriimonas ginsengisoli Gsoil 348 GN=OP10G_2085 PE=4 SV=1: AHS1 [Tuwongella immobilis]
MTATAPPSRGHLPTMEPIGDCGWMFRFPNESQAIAFTQIMRRRAASGEANWLEDVVPAYSTVGVFVDSQIVSHAHAGTQLADWLHADSAAAPTIAKATFATVLHRIPCCYELGPDLDRVATKTGRSAEQVIARHTAEIYTVYAIGFCPGFPYLGYLPAELTGVPRLESPRLRVEPGSVGLTGRQTGLYPLARPGGWNLIGRTPLTIVDVEQDFFPIHVGDQVQFVRIDAREFDARFGERLPNPRGG